MSVAVVALVLGLVLLVAAAGLFLRASNQEREDGLAAEPDELPRPIPQPTPPTPVTEPVPAEPAEPATAFGGRRGRRNWALAHSFEYTREDAFLTAEWPVSLVRELTPSDSGPVVRDLVSGFLDGHQLHIGDIAGSTVLALRRGAYSPVDVHASTTAAMPAGMRHDATLDRAPYSVYTTDPRAVGRMTDSRVEEALAGMAGTVTDIAWSGAWVVARCGRKTEPDRWDTLLPNLVALSAASRVLPPLVTSATLDVSAADPTRPRPATGVQIDVSGPSEGAGPDSEEAPRPGHLRAVPDAPASEPTDPPPPEQVVPERPTVERPTTPVEFPSRSQNLVFGDTDLEGTWPEDVAEDGLTSIPALGEEQTDSPGPGRDDPRIVRTGASATIFDDPQQPLRGRHRGPDARHAGVDDGDRDGDYDVVDPEVVDPDNI